VIGDQLQKAIRGWLSPPDPWKNHHIAHESRHEATATWFIQGEIFSEWKLSGSSKLLWVHGKRQLPRSRYYAFAETNGHYLFRSGCRKERVLVRQPLRYLALKTYDVGQFYNHRGHRGNAKIGARVIGVLLP
jgi:hypothetical protein